MWRFRLLEWLGASLVGPKFRYGRTFFGSFLSLNFNFQCQIVSLKFGPLYIVGKFFVGHLLVHQESQFRRCFLQNHLGSENRPFLGQNLGPWIHSNLASQPPCAPGSQKTRWLSSGRPGRNHISWEAYPTVETHAKQFLLVQESLAKTESIHLNKKLITWKLPWNLELALLTCLDSRRKFLCVKFHIFFAGRLKPHRFLHRFQTRSSTTCSVQKKPHGKPDVQCIAHCSNGFLWLWG